MGIQKSEAIVLKTFDFRETSLIATFFTKDFGKIHGLIKGIRNKPQRYGGLPLVFSCSSIVFYESPKNDLNLVTQCDAKEVFGSIRTDLEKTNYANYLVELLDAVTAAFDKNEGLYELMLNSLQSLCTDSENRQIARIFEVKLLNLSGFRPRLDACVNCQKEIEVQGRFSSILGGILCPRCANLDRSAKTLLRGTLASIDYIEKTDWRKTLHLKMAHGIAAELKEILTNFLDVHLDKKSKSRKFLI